MGSCRTSFWKVHVDIRVLCTVTSWAVFPRFPPQIGRIVGCVSMCDADVWTRFHMRMFDIQFQEFWPGFCPDYPAPFSRFTKVSGDGFCLGSSMFKLKVPNMFSHRVDLAQFFTQHVSQFVIHVYCQGHCFIRTIDLGSSFPIFPDFVQSLH